MTRDQFILRLVLDSICNDFENVDQIILPEVAESVAKCGLTVHRAEIVSALTLLVERGWAKPYDLSIDPRNPLSTELHQMPSLDIVEEYYFKIYFYITEKGKQVHLFDDSWWPFDDEDNLRPDWRLDKDVI